MRKTDETGVECRQIRAFENFEFRDLHLLLVTFVSVCEGDGGDSETAFGTGRTGGRLGLMTVGCWKMSDHCSGRLGLGWKLLDLTGWQNHQGQNHANDNNQGNNSKQQRREQHKKK